MNQHSDALTLPEFMKAVCERVMQALGDEAGAVRASDHGAEYAREALTVRVGEEDGMARMTYVKRPTPLFGHSSGAGLTYRMAHENVEAIANEVVVRLMDLFVYR